MGRYKLKMEHFTKSEIESYRESYNFHAGIDGQIKGKHIINLMRSSGTYPTPNEVQILLKNYGKAWTDPIDFPTFLHFINDQLHKEDAFQEIKSSLSCSSDSRGYVSAKQLRSILTKTGEKLTDDDVDQILMLANTNPNGKIKDQDGFVRAILKPLPFLEDDDDDEDDF